MNVMNNTVQTPLFPSCFCRKKKGLLPLLLQLRRFGQIVAVLENVVNNQNREEMLYQ